MDRRRQALTDEGLVLGSTLTMNTADDGDPAAGSPGTGVKGDGGGHRDARPSMARALSGGIGLLAQPRSSSLTNPTDSTFPESAATSSGPAVSPAPSLLFSPPLDVDAPVPMVLLDAPSPAPHISRSSPPPPSTLDAPAGSTSPRTPPNLRLEIPPQGTAPDTSRDTLRAPFAPDSENEGICTEVGSLGQEIQLESGDHLNALERIYLYTQSKATFHRIFMSRALPTYLNEVTPTEAVEYVLPLLGGLAIDEEERVKETFVGELLVIIWWFFTTCRVTDQDPEPVESGPENPDADPPLVSVQSFSAVLASLLLSSNPEVSATARGTVVELLGRTRWIVKQTEVDQGGQTLDDVQYTRYCETMRPVEPWSRGLLGPDEARMIQLEIIYSVVIDLGRLDLNGEEYAEEYEGEGGEPHELPVVGDDLPVVGEDEPEPSVSDEPNSFVSGDRPNSILALPPVNSALVDPARTPTAETNSYVLEENEDTGSSTRTSVSSKNTGYSSASSSATSLELPLRSVGVSPGQSQSQSGSSSTPTSVGGDPNPFSGSAGGDSRSLPASASGDSRSLTNSTSGADSSSSLNLPELSPGDSSSRSSVASPTEPISPPEGNGADYVTTVVQDSFAQDSFAPNSFTQNQFAQDSFTQNQFAQDSFTQNPFAQDSLSVPSSDGETDELMWHTPRGSEGFDTGYFDPPSGASPNGSGSTVSGNGSGSFSGPTGFTLSNPTRSSPLANGAGSGISANATNSSPLASATSSSPLPTPTAGLAPPRPTLGRRDSVRSIGTASELGPDDYADAESGDGWEEEGYFADVGEVQSVEEVPVVGEDAVSEEGVASEGEYVAGTEAMVDDAYIDDGAAAEEAAIGRVASMSLIAAVTSSGVVDDEIYSLFIEEVLRVSANPVYWVRSETSYALGTLAKTVSEDMVEPYLLPILEALMNDTEAHVRQSSVFAIPSVLKRLSPPRRRELAAQYVLKLCEDTADTVRTGALQVLAEVIHTFHEDQGGPPDELVDFFLQGEKEQIRAPLPKPPAEQQKTPSEKDPYAEWGTQSVATWGAEPSSYFEAEPSFPEPDRALICAFNYPAIALTLGAERWSRLSEYYHYLAEESWHTPKVRATLAASAGEMARIVGPKAALADVVPVWWICLSSDQRDAKIKALKALPMLLEALDPEGRADVAAKMGDAWDNHVSGWKEREAFARQLGAVAPLLKTQGLALCRIFKSGLEDRVVAIREAVVEALPVLHDVLKDNTAHIKVARDDLFALGASGMCRHKTTFLACCRALVQSPQGTSILNDSRFGSSIVPLAEHSVVDVRIALGRLLTVICEHHMHTWKQRPQWVVDCLEKLSLDASTDVRAFVHRVSAAEYIEPQSTTDKRKPDVRASSPPYAEFSRPP